MNYLKRAGVQWERRVRKSLSAMSNELKLSLQCQTRNQAERDELAVKWEELSNFQIDLSSYRPVYAPKDLLEVLLSLKGPSTKQEADDVVPKWEFSHINLPVKNISELRTLYAELLRNDTTFHEWQMTSEKVLSANHAPLCQQVLKKGLTPTPLRGQLWSTVLGSEIQDHVSQGSVKFCNSHLIISALLIAAHIALRSFEGRRFKLRLNYRQIDIQGHPIDCNQR